MFLYRKQKKFSDYFKLPFLYLVSWIYFCSALKPQGLVPHAQETMVRACQTHLPQIKHIFLHHKHSRVWVYKTDLFKEVLDQ